MKKYFRWIVTFAVVFLSACSQSGNPPETAKYMKTFGHILTNQYLWTYGSGGIYWVSDNHVLLEAHVKNSKGALDRGLYQVDINDGSYLKIVDVPDDSPITYIYCFDGSVLHVRTRRGEFSVENIPTQYRVEITSMGKKTRSNRYSGLRCELVELPKEEKVAYIPLRKGDGYIKNQAGKKKSDPVKAFVVDEQGNIVEELTDSLLDSRGVIGVRRFIPHENAYFGYSSFEKNCSYLTFIYRTNWDAKQVELCLQEWSFGSKIVHGLRGAIYVEHHNDIEGDPKTYAIRGDLSVPIERQAVRGSSVSMDGCLVAYGVNRRMNGGAGSRQLLKIFDFCKFERKGS